MTKPLVICPTCGAEVPLDRYCSSCGNPLIPDLELVIKDEPVEEEQMEETIPPEASPSVEATTTAAPIDEGHLPKLPVTVEDMDYLVLTYLLTQSELTILNSDLDRLIDKIRATRQALSLDHADKQVLAARAEELKLALERTKARKNELLRVRLSVPLQDLASNLRSEKTKLAKLEKISSTVDPQVYREQQRELSERIKSLKREVKREIKLAHTWLKAMRKKQRVIEREINRLEAKHKIGEISTAQYETQRTQTERSLHVLLGGIELLEKIVKFAEKT
ncbi:MAG: hypothetical protein K9W43_09630 [Candidatus Thorarchaeota archaeon]|nr:hypothetical protein [Candidatus Thorarchaeota archaeon]